MHAAKRKWFLTIEEFPTSTLARFYYSSKGTGVQIWDEMYWPLPASALSEGAILDEFYQVMMEFRATRG